MRESRIRALLDTNELIDIENPDKPLSKTRAAVLRESQNLVHFLYHPLQTKELKKNKNKEHVDWMLSRLERYSPIESYDVYKSEDFVKMGLKCNNSHDLIDCHLLMTVKNLKVHYLVTEDSGIHKNAARLGLHDRVIRFDDLQAITRDYQDEVPEFAAVRDSECSELNIDDVFFDSLRDSYGVQEFNSWFEKIARSGRRCWTVFDRQNNLSGLCIYKSEKEEILTQEGFSYPGKTLKLCTIKVAPNARGSKIGERLLYSAFRYAKDNNYGFIYFHTDEQSQKGLIKLAEDFFFERLGARRGQSKDVVFGKYIEPSIEDIAYLDKAGFLNKYYPSYRVDDSVKKFIVPIEPRWHERLFPDISKFKDSILGNSSEMYPPESKTIRKAYICQASIKRIEPGDLVFFYRSKDRKNIQVIGGVQCAIHSDNVDDIYELVRRRTVYTKDQIQKALTSSADGRLLVILFDLLEYIKNPITYSDMKSMGLYAPRSVQTMNGQLVDMLSTRLEGAYL